MVSFDPNVKNNMFKVNELNPYKEYGVSFVGAEAGVATGEAYSERHGVGKAAGVDSNGVLGEVTGTGQDGKHRLNMYM